MNMTDFRVLLYTVLPPLAAVLPWVVIEDGNLIINIEAFLASLAAAWAAITAVYAKWGKR